ncbi:MAG: serine/threonine protein kinase [Bacteroides sp.]|nr:serine/threonine protein kinase [Bacteroides sp.]
MQLHTNTYLQAGKYRIIRVLGQGGFGITYLAENILFEKQVAIKEFFPKDFCGRDNTSHLTLGTQNNADTVARLRDRFIKEAKNIAKLDHPGIVKIHDIFEENSTAYYVMDYIEGENLNEMVKRNGPLSESKAIDYIRKVGDALDYIHSRNMTHFDVKPANIVVREKDDQPILIDFGLSKQYDMNGDATSTLMHAVSQGYSPIELYNAGSITSFSPQIDVYSLAATLFYLVTGTVPPQASSILNDGFTLPYGLSSIIVLAINSGMTVRKKDRPSSVYSWLDSLPSKPLSNNHSASSHQAQSTPTSTINPNTDNEETTLFTDYITPTSHTSSNIFDEQNFKEKPERDTLQKVVSISGLSSPTDLFIVIAAIFLFVVFCFFSKI